ncbi:hypothetical protein N7491_000291 [Penicillium cf. griseofulvum]|uniref:chitinase n=1 Tax=Penicillium cf. griseofulvum TaxID=2972120 RepID=A0A9W9MEL7_9EURO|nr:hypothetical protein N7472_004352 [Penicillium cf. griseofulvum]KAJ5441913.1 hypothetical protein N7445_004920 [Penicillium cf. griseofulvum]KAJ5451109.1 hypothetical protein N7491_000291 [Penicillium cf. griseofulvum]
MPGYHASALALDASLKNNVVIYYGQGVGQDRLSHFCNQTSMHIINIGFINEGYSSVPGGWQEGPALHWWWSVDGFDFDVECNGGVGWSAMIDRLRLHYSQVSDQTFFISGAPQRPIPDAQLGAAIKNSVFDFIWVQWYNSPFCAAANGTGFNFDKWVEVIREGANEDAKLFIGLPASKTAANASYYLTPAPPPQFPLPLLPLLALAPALALVPTVAPAPASPRSQ